MYLRRLPLGGGARAAAPPRPRRPRRRLPPPPCSPPRARPWLAPTAALHPVAVATSHYRRLPPILPHLEPATCSKEPAHKQVWFAAQSSPGVEPGLLQHVREVGRLMSPEFRAVLKALGGFAPAAVGADLAHEAAIRGAAGAGWRTFSKRLLGMLHLRTANMVRISCVQHPRSAR